MMSRPEEFLCSPPATTAERPCRQIPTQCGVASSSDRNRQSRSGTNEFAQMSHSFHISGRCRAYVPSRYKSGCCSTDRGSSPSIPSHFDILMMSYITDPPRPSTWQLAQTAIRKATGKVSVTTYIPYDVQNVGHGSGTATVVDKKLGLVLTNAHIMGDAPSECEFTIGDKKVSPVAMLV